MRTQGSALHIPTIAVPLSLIRFRVAGQPWLADLTRPIDLARVLAFGTECETWFGAPPPTAIALESGAFVGDVTRGGSANASVLRLTPHGNGTHTESVGHLTSRADPVDRALTPGLLLATLATIRSGSEQELEAVLEAREPGFVEALVLRGAPSSGGFDPRGLGLVASRGVRHLIVEPASLDPERDGGALAAHRAFWGLEHGSRTGWSPRTVTELAVIPPDLSDGPYLLDLQTPRMSTEAVPSRPVLYPVFSALE